ncbi:MAG: hypothetical protein Q9159_007627 [Coniocarpon cinnabarinum]
MSDALKDANQQLENIQTSQQAREATNAAQQSDNVAHALAGAGGGLLSMALTYPLITLSTRAQVESKRAQSSMLDAVRHIVDREGVGGLFSGLDSALFGISVTNFVYYYWYEWSRAAFERASIASGRGTRKLTTTESMMAGAVAGSATVLITNPIWVINTRMTARQQETKDENGRVTKPPSTIGTLLKMLKEEGPMSLFAGVMPALVLVINPILQYTVYEQLKNFVERRRKVGPTDSFYLGAIGKLIATAVTYPYLTVKSRAHVAGKEGPKDNMFTSFNKILRDEGWSGLYGVMAGNLLGPSPATPRRPSQISTVSQSPTQDDPSVLLQTWQPRKQPPSATLAAPREAKPDRTSSNTAFVDLLTDDEQEAAAKPAPRPILTSRYPPSAVFPGKTQPYVLPSGSHKCPFPQCHRYGHSFSGARKLKKHLIKRHKWPRSVLESESEISGAQSHQDKSETVRSRSETPTGVNTTPLTKSISVEPVNPPVEEVNGLTETEASNPAAGPAGDVVKLTGGETNGTGSENSSPTTAPSAEQQESAPANDAMPTNKAEKASSDVSERFTANLQQTRKRSVDGTLKIHARGEQFTDAESQVPASVVHPQGSAPSPNANRKTRAPKTLNELQQMVPERFILTRKTQDLYNKVPESAVRSGGAWTDQETELIFHLKDEINLRWIDMEPFFSYRGKWNVPQSRYSMTKRKRRDALNSSPQVVPNETSATEPVEQTEALLEPTAKPASTVLTPVEGTRRSARATNQPGDYQKFFRFRTQQDLEEGLELPAEAEAFEPRRVRSPLTTVDEENVERIPQKLSRISKPQLQLEIARNDSAIGSLSPKIPRSPTAQNTRELSNKRRSVQIHRPYLSASTRDFLHDSIAEQLWDVSAISPWDGQELHVDFTDVEANLVRETILRTWPHFTEQQANGIGLHLDAATPADIDAIARAATQSDRWPRLSRTLDSIRCFLSDAVKGQTSSHRTIDRLQISDTRQGHAQLAQSLRRRELSGKSLPKQLPNQLLAPQLRFKGTSSDVDSVVWSPNGRYFAVGSAAFTDESSMQYNRPNNLLFGDYQRSRLLELPNHAMKREPTTGVNATAAMQATQDTLLFATISDVQFSSDSKVMFTAGYDKHIRLWEIGRYLQNDLDPTSGGPRCRWSLPKTSKVDLVSVAPGPSDGPHLFAAATRTLSRKKDPIRLYSYVLDGTDVIEDCEDERRTFGAENEQVQLDTCCLRFSPSFGVQGKYLLGGFIARDDSERRGEACLWDIETSQRIVSLTRRAVYDIQWSPNVFGRFAIGCSAANTANRGTKTVVRLHDSRWLPSEASLSAQAHATFELECPALDMNDVLFNPRDPNLVSAGCTDGTAYVWDLRNPDTMLHRFGHGEPLNELDQSRSREEADTGIRFLSWDQDGRQLFTGSSDGVVACWDPYMAPQNAFEREVVRMDSGIMAGAFSPDHTSLVIGDVEGSVLMLSVGGECEPFEFVADEETKQQIRQAIGSDDTTDESAKQISDELVQRGEIELKPFGDFPRRQAVQGPRYDGPFDTAGDAGELRRHAAKFQARAQAIIRAQESSIALGSAEQTSVAEAFRVQPVETLEHYHDLWEMDPLALMNR